MALEPKVISPEMALESKVISPEMVVETNYQGCNIRGNYYQP
jgi:hypothetical protein